MFNLTKAPAEIWELFYFPIMITGERKKILSTDSVLNLISSFDIFRMYMPDNTWKINTTTYSPFRKEECPSFLIGNRNGELHFVDFSTGDRGDCFDFVQKKFHLSSLHEALHKIDEDFGLGICSEAKHDYKTIVGEYKQPESLGKRYSLIQVETRKFTKEDLAYWNSYHQGIEDLRANNVYSIKSVFLNKARHPIKEELRFGYLYQGGWWKIYVPYAERKKKWLSNVPLAMPYGLENLRADKNTLITKSMKDFLVCRKVYEYVMHVQNESLGAFSEETVCYINEHSKHVYYGGDSDSQGKNASYAVTQAFGWKHINSPDRLLPDVKDFADWGKLEGIDVIREHFKIKGLIE